MKTPVCTVLDDIRSLHNVGAMFRTADGCNIEKVYLCGYTGTPPRKEITKTALGADQSVAWEKRASALRLIRFLKKKGWQIVVLERSHNSVSYSKAVFHFPVCLVVGNEVTGVNPNILGIADCIISIPMLGKKESLNVATAFGIALYKILEKVPSAKNF